MIFYRASLNAINVSKFAKFSMFSYIAMGWMIIIAFLPLTETIEYNGIVLLVLGGVAYTVGSILYGLGKKVKYFHSVWHLFVLVGGILHYISILLYVIMK
jgi:hemolysin III